MRKSPFEKINKMCMLSFPRLKILVQKKHICLNMWTYFRSWEDVFLPPWACSASDGECSQFPVEQEKQQPGERTLLDCFILLYHVSTARFVMQKQKRLSYRKGRKTDTAEETWYPFPVITQGAGWKWGAPRKDTFGQDRPDRPPNRRSFHHT